MNNIYISRVIIKNYRNFKDVDINLNNKQVIIGENNVGKTNFLRAIQLILDPTFSDDDRMLEETDFWSGTKNPMENKTVIEIKIYISNFKQNRTILAVLDNATITDENGEEKLLITYKFSPTELENGKIEYSYNIFKGDDESKRFTYEDRKYLNIRVIKALRDVELEMKNSKISPINKLIKEYEINKKALEEMSKKYEETGLDVLELDEIKDLSSNINKRFTSVLGNESYNISFKPFEIEPNKILSSLKLLLDKRNISDVSLGINNILYISLVLQLLQDKSIPTYMTNEKFTELLACVNSDILSKTYIQSNNNNYFLKQNLVESEITELQKFMNLNNYNNQGITILAIEEPEAHLHPVFQRLIYRDVIRKNANSVLMTTHSTHITSIAPIDSIVHMQFSKANGTIINSTSELNLEKDLEDVERYIDVKRGEIYLGKGVILVEGIAEEYIIPKFSELLNLPLNEKGIIVCNIDSTNFTPYVKLLKCLNIPYVIITDGDFYYIDEKDNKKFNITDEELGETKNKGKGFDGLERMQKLVKALSSNEKMVETNIDNQNKESIDSEYKLNTNIEDQEKELKKSGIFTGTYTLEIDIMAKAQINDKTEILCNVFNNLTNGGDKQKENFKNEINSKKFSKCLNKIENNGIGKGRFAQRLSNSIVIECIPEYISEAIKYIYKKVD